MNPAIIGPDETRGATASASTLKLCLAPRISGHADYMMDGDLMSMKPEASRLPRTIPSRGPRQRRASSVAEHQRQGFNQNIGAHADAVGSMMVLPVALTEYSGA